LVFLLVVMMPLMPCSVAMWDQGTRCVNSQGIMLEEIYTKNYVGVHPIEEEISSNQNIYSDGLNLLSNPSFEDGFDGPLGWKHRAACGPTVYTWDSKYSYTGAHSIGILNVSSSCNPDNYWFSNDYIDVDFTNFSYQFSAHYQYLGKSDNAPVGAITLFTYDATRFALQNWKLEFPRIGDDWTYLEVTIDSSTFSDLDTKVEFVRIGLFATSYLNDALDTEIRFDDIFFGIAENASENSPPNAPIISGPVSGEIGKEYLYNFTATDPDGDRIYLWIQWGGGCPIEDWIGPFESGERVSLNQTWDTKGTYIISARAKDIYGTEGDAGVLSISMPLRRQTLLEKIIEFMIIGIACVQDKESIKWLRSEKN